MRQVLFILLLLGFFKAGAQNDVSVKFFLEDNAGRKDTVEIGMYASSTIGIDVGLGEVDIYGTPWDTLDARVIQRDSLNHNCIRIDHFTQGAPFLYFSGNIDTKKDLRPFMWPFASPNNNLEIKVEARDYPVTVQADFTDLTGSIFDAWSVVFFLDSTCESVQQTNMWAGSNPSDTIFTLQDSTYNTFIGHFEHHVGIAEIDSRLVKIKPNPTSNSITITLEERTTGTLYIRNTLGQLVASELLKDKTRLELDLSTYTRGLYFIQLESEGKLITKKILKQ